MRGELVAVQTAIDGSRGALDRAYGERTARFDEISGLNQSRADLLLPQLHREQQLPGLVSIATSTLGQPSHDSPNNARVQELPNNERAAPPPQPAVPQELPAVPPPPPAFKQSLTNYQIHQLLIRKGIFEGNASLRKQSFRNACSLSREEYRRFSCQFID